MSDHYHYGYADERHDHHGQYAEDRHDHSLDYAEKYHRHYDDESTVRGLREDLSRAESEIYGLREDVRKLYGLLDLASGRISDMEGEHATDVRRLWDHIGNMPGGI